MGKKAYKVGSITGLLAQSSGSEKAALDPKLCDIFSNKTHVRKPQPAATTADGGTESTSSFTQKLKRKQEKLFSAFNSNNNNVEPRIVKKERFSNNEAASIRIQAKRKLAESKESDELNVSLTTEDGSSAAEPSKKKKKKSLKKIDNDDADVPEESFTSETKKSKKKNKKGKTLQTEISIEEDDNDASVNSEKKGKKKSKKLAQADSKDEGDAGKAKKKSKKRKSKGKVELLKSIPMDNDQIITEFENEQEDNSDTSLDSDDEEGKTDANKKEADKSKKLKNFELNKPKDKNPEQEGRTVFVGNLPPYVIKKKLKKLFDPFGTIEAIRYRCAAPQKPYLLKKVAVNSKKLNPNQYNLVAYIRFKTIEEAEKAAAELNGHQMDQHAIVVDLAENKTRDNKKAIFIGNLPLKIQDDTVRKFFVDCGKISSVRIVRNPVTGLGRGIGYINFESVDAVELALKKDGETLDGRPIRVNKAVKKEKKSKEQLIKEKAQKYEKNHGPKKAKQGMGNNAARRIEKKNKNKASDEVKFTGDRLAEIGVLKRKSNKPDKGELKKARIASKLTGVSSTQFKKFNREKGAKWEAKKKNKKLNQGKKP